MLRRVALPATSPKRAALSPLVALLAAAACLPLALTAAGSPGEPAAGALALRDCVAQELDLVVDRASALALVPDGFTPTRPLNFHSTDPSGQLAYLMLVTESCRTASDGEPATFFAAWLPVIAPPQHRLEGAVLHAVQVGFATDRADVAGALAAWDVEAAVGTVRLTRSDVLDADSTRVEIEVGATRVVMDSASADAARAAQLVASPNPNPPTESFRAFVVRDRALLGAIDYTLEPHRHVRGAASMSIDGEGGLFPRPLLMQSSASSVALFGGITMAYAPLDAA